MEKMMMEAGDWLDHGGMVRGGAHTVQVRGGLGKNAAVVIGKGQWVNLPWGKQRKWKWYKVWDTNR